ncbi:MAG: outer membrane protein transport protein [Bacteroidales bacterium]|nr:outer membrane protein transport protein [Bacteroidales bacterium]
MLKKSERLIRSLTLTVVFLLVAYSGIAQIAINSPYSRFGVGDLATRRNAYQFSMGGISAAVTSNRYINPYNPASNYSFDSVSFIFSGGIIGSSGNLKTDASSNSTNYATLGYLLFGFPINHWLKTSIGLAPYSNVGYNVASGEVLDSIGSTEFKYQGSGGLNEFYGNASIEPFKNFAIGVKMAYMFGESDNAQSIFFPDSAGYLNTKVNTFIDVGDLYFEYGLQYHREIGKDLTLGLGAVYAPKQNISATENYLVRSYFPTSLGIESFRDTIVTRLKNEGDIVFPDKYTFGFTLKKEDHWMVGADYSWQNWSDFKAFGRSDSLTNTMAFNIGGEFTPSSSITSNYWKRVKYRAGFRYNKTYLNIRDNQINEFGISFGMGMPIPRSLSTFNFGIEIGRRGTTAVGLIQSNYIKFTLGVSVWERWFVKNKYN